MCGEKTCLAFAGAVFCGTRKIQECPKLSSQVLAQYAPDGGHHVNQENDAEAYIADLKSLVKQIDFREAAMRIGAQILEDVLQVKILGKPFCIRKDGTFSTDIHINPWIVIPLLLYVLQCKGRRVSGQWVSFRELPGGREKYALFKKRGEDVLQQLADRYTDFFDEVLHMFDGRMEAKHLDADVSVVLHPLPLVPMMICYWKPSEGMASSLNIFFDECVGDNLGADLAFSLGTGIVQMLEKLAAHHGF